MGEGFPFVDSGASPPGYRPVEENSRDSLLPKNILDIQANVNREAVKRIPAEKGHGYSFVLTIDGRRGIQFGQTTTVGPDSLVSVVIRHDEQDIRTTLGKKERR